MENGGAKRCACKGFRSCSLCEEGGREAAVPLPLAVDSTFIITQCRLCGELQQKEAAAADGVKGHVTCIPQKVWSPHYSSLPEVQFDGVSVVHDFVSIEEEEEVMREIDKQQWVESQSGRRKQDYGPKVNFKRRKLRVGVFNGLPSFSKQLVQRIRTEVQAMADFEPVELCNLDYRPERGAAIDPHMDDTWVWGERLVTLNLLSDTILTFTTDTTPHRVEIHMPRRSLVIVRGTARYHWQHSILRCHVTSRRVAVTLRELSQEFLPGGQSYETVGKNLLTTAALYTGHPVNKPLPQHQEQLSTQDKPLPTKQ